MSRCFPYPPPGYTLSNAWNEALIESMKFQKEKQRKKEKRMEKKEKRKEGKEKRKEGKEKSEKKKEKSRKLDKSDIVKGHIGKVSCLDTKDKFLHILHTTKEAESQQPLERSSLTEEHARPINLPVPSTSSESTENSNKRKRHTSPINGSHSHSKKVILLRLPSKKQNEFDALSKERLCSTSGRIDLPVQNKDVTNRGFTHSTNRERTCLTSGKMEAIASGKKGIKSTPNAVLNPVPRVEIQYKDLIENWVPQRLQDACLYPDDLDWLFQGGNEDVRAEKRQRSGSDIVSCSRSSGLWPRAEFLHEIDAYALPFTVPY